MVVLAMLVHHILEYYKQVLYKATITKPKQTKQQKQPTKQLKRNKTKVDYLL